MEKKNKKPCTAIVVAAGQGKRMGGKVEKQFLELQGKPIVYYSLAAFQRSPLIDHVILVSKEEQIAYCQKEIVEKYGLSKVDSIVAGGAERYFSVWKGLKVMEDEMSQEDREGYVFVHDGVRPFVEEEMLERAVEAVEKYQACVIGMPVKETIKVSDEEGFVDYTPARKLVWSIQTPQVFQFRIVRDAYQALIDSGRSDMTDDAMIVETFADMRVKIVEGDYHNINLTTAEDLEVAKVFMRQ